MPDGILTAVFESAFYKAVQSIYKGFTGASAFDPASLFTGGYTGFWLDFSDLSTMFQDTAGSTPVTTSGDPIGRINDKSGNGNTFEQATSGARPVYTVASSLSSGVLDGIDDFLKTANNVDFSATDKVTVFIAVRKDSDSTTGMILEHSTNSQALGGTFSIWKAGGGAASQDWTSYLNGTQVSFYLEKTYAAPITNVISVLFDIAGAARVDEIVTRINGATPSTRTGGGGANAGTGNFTNTTTEISRRFKFAGSIYQVLVVGKACSATEINNVEQYMAVKSGLSF